MTGAVAPRILFLDQFGTLGGGQRILLGMVRRGVERGWVVGVALPFGPLASELTALGADVYPLDIPTLTDGSKSLGDAFGLAFKAPSLVRQFNAAANEHQPDIVHVNGPRALLPAVLGRRVAPITVHVHTLVSGSSARLMRPLLASKRVVHLVVPSTMMATHVQKSLGVSSERLATIANWVDPRFTSPTAASTDRLTRGGGHPVIVAVIGRVTPIKGQLHAVQAVLDARRAGADVVLRLVGAEDRAYADEIERVASADPGAVVRLGPNDDIPNLLGNVDLAMVPSLWAEPFGLAAVEAMSAGVPVITYDSGALGEVVGDAGVVVPSGDQAALSAALLRLVHDEGERNRLMAMGRQRAVTLFSYELQTDKLYALFEAVSQEAR